MLTIPQAVEHALAAASCLNRPRTIELKHAYGRVLAQDVLSPSSIPREALATMDGFALRASEAQQELKITGASMAGAPYSGSVAAGCAIRIATGAVVPQQLDCVIPIEDAAVSKQDSVIFRGGPHSNIRAPGEDLAAGACAVSAGTLLAAPQLALLRSIGVGRITVHAQPRIALLSTGDELRETGEHLPTGAIYDANRQMLAAQLTDMGFESVDLGIVRDDQEQIASCLDHAAAQSDVIISTGGASVGARDLIKQVLEQNGKLELWKVAIKPGKPFIVGSYRSKPFYGLPGNPASSYVCLMMLAAPALWKIAGREPIPTWPRIRATTTEKLAKSPGRTDYQRGIATQGENGSWTVASAGAQGSASISVLARANCLIELASSAGEIPAGQDVSIIPIAGLRP